MQASISKPITDKKHPNSDLMLKNSIFIPNFDNHNIKFIYDFFGKNFIVGMIKSSILHRFLKIQIIKKTN